MSVPKKFYLLAIKTAAKSRHPKYQMGAVIFRSGRVLAQAANAGRLQGHAEERALKRAKDVAGASVVVARIGGGHSKPCLSCYRLMKAAGIKRVIFVELNGAVVDYRMNELEESNLRDYCQPRYA